MLRRKTDGLVCESCLKTYPVPAACRRLIDELRSIFNADEIANGEKNPTPESGWKYRLRNGFLLIRGNRDHTSAIQELRAFTLVSGCVGDWVGNTRKMYGSVPFKTGLVLTDIN